jgi:hypothetical protein
MTSAQTELTPWSCDLLEKLLVAKPLMEPAA